MSVDSLDSQRFERITGSRLLDSVVAGVEAAVAARDPEREGERRAARGDRRAELDAFLSWTRDRPLTVRFIELMRTRENAGYFRRHHVPADSIRRELEARGWRRLARDANDGPAIVYGHSAHEGKAGLIAPYSPGFCDSCNRVRVSSTGALKLCLFGEREIPLRPYLQSDDRRRDLVALIASSVQAKPPRTSCGRDPPARRRRSRPSAAEGSGRCTSGLTKEAGRVPPMRRFRPVIPRLERRRNVDRAWQLYVREGLEPAGIAEEISRSWRRARELHRIDPGITRPGGVLSSEALATRRARDEVFRLATPILADFARRLGLHDAVLAYLDGDGWMLSIDGDRDVVEQVEEIDFRPGALWSEEVAGTNGPGTALVEGRPVEVFASEHFVSAWQPWSCAAVPIQAPGEERPVGVVDLTGPWEVHRRHALLIAKAIARAIEERLRAVASVRDEVVRYAFRAAHEAGDALVAVDARGRIIAANDAAGRRRIVEAGALAGAAREGFAAALRLRPRLDRRRAPGDAGGSDPRRVAGAVPRARSSARSSASARRRPTRAGLAREQQPPPGTSLCRIHGESEPLRRALELARTAARNDLPVVLCGESGTGKELLAHAIHSAGARRDDPFVVVNCGAIPAQLVEVELFGYEPGTFTGARTEGSPGRFEEAHGRHAVPRRGERAAHCCPGGAPAGAAGSGDGPDRRQRSRPLDVRVMAASRKPLDVEIGAGRFRRDLYYRLAVLSIAIPPLRDRGDDVALLAQAFLVEAESEVGRAGLALGSDALDALRAHAWPGNVRELKNVMLRAAATASGPQNAARDLLLDGVAPDAPPAATRGSNATLRTSMLESERDALLAALDAASWNVARAAEQLGVSRMTLYRRLQRHGISRALASR